VTEIISRLSPISADTFLLSILIALITFVAVPIAVTFYLKRERKRRRKLVSSPRKIALASEEVAPRSCEHMRSKSRAKQSADGGFMSICRKCGASMRRKGPGNWVLSQQA
jgi:hypothetical protein